MRYSFCLINYTTGDGPLLELGFDTLSISLQTSDPAETFTETYASVEEMDAGYQARVAPYLRDNDCFDTERGAEAQPIANLAAYHAEQLACAGAPGVGDTPLDQLVLDVAALLRQRINVALGATSIALHAAVICLADHGITGICINPPGLVDIDEEQLAVATRTDGWPGDDYRRTGAWSLEDNQLGPSESLEPYGDIDNLYDPAVARLLYLACAHIEAAPNLRANADTGAGLWVLWIVHDDDGIAIGHRALAAAYVGEAAADYFDRAKAT